MAIQVAAPRQWVRITFEMKAQYIRWGKLRADFKLLFFLDSP